MFVKKLVEKASRKTVGGGGVHGLKAEDVNPHLVFHHGIPTGASVMAYDHIQSILAISTIDGRIKLFGKDGTQTLLQSKEAVPSKFLQFIENHGILLNINFQNHIEVWDIDKKELSYMHKFNEEITSYAVMQQSFYLYVGDCLGDISILKLNQEDQKLVNMKYRIPLTESHDTTNEAVNDTAVVCILPQPMAESKRVLIIFRDGLISLWGIQESKVAFNTGLNTQLSSNSEPKKAVAACWACPSGSKVVVGYSNGEILLWAIPVISDQKHVSVKKKESIVTQNVPLSKLNLGYKTDKVPIVSLRWVTGDGSDGRLYVNGFTDQGSCSFQIIVLNEKTESRTIKLALLSTEACMAMEIISCSSDRSKNKQNALVLLLKSGQICLYNESEIENYLLQSQTKSIPSPPNRIVVKLPFGDSSISIAKVYTDYTAQSILMDEEHLLLVKKYSYLFSVDKRDKDANHSSSSYFSGFTNTRSIYITGHQDGAINFWDSSCPLFLPILSIKQQSEDSNSSITSLHFDISSQILVTGDQNGWARIITFKKGRHSSENMFSFLQAKQDSNYTSRSIKVKGAIQSISINTESSRLSIGTDKGFIFVFDMEGTNILYQKQLPSHVYTGICSMQFENCNHNGYAKNVLLVGMQDSSILTLEEDTGNELSPSIHIKKSSRALLMETLAVSPDGECSSGSGYQDTSKENYVRDSITKQSLLLFCSETAVRLYSLSHAIQGIKKIHGKKKFSGTCCFASIVHGPSGVGLVLIFGNGKLEIRSLPDLILLKEASLRGFKNPTSKSCPNINDAICASPEGEILIVNGDQEMFFFSVLFQHGTYRHLKNVSQVYKKGIVAPDEGSLNLTNAHKEKKKGIFGIVKDLTGNKPKQSQKTDLVDSSENDAEELYVIFSTANFPLESKNSPVLNAENIEVDIDDIDLEDAKEKPKERTFSVINTQKFGKKFQAIKDKLKQKTDETSNSMKNNEEDDNSNVSVDQIKKKYGFAVNNEMSAPRIAQSKLSENVKKLEGINDRTAQMEDTAKSFSTVAKELLKTVQKR